MVSERHAAFLDSQTHFGSPSVPMHMKFGHSHPNWCVKSMRLCQYDIGKWQLYLAGLGTIFSSLNGASHQELWCLCVSSRHFKHIPDSWSRLKMSIHDDQKAKSSHVNHSRILEHELGCDRHGFRASRCVFWAPRLILVQKYPEIWKFSIPYFWLKRYSNRPRSPCRPR